jgi:RecA-family ATPase
MTDLSKETTDYGEFLAGLESDEARQRAMQQLKQLVLAQLPDKDVGKPPISTLGEYLDTEIELPPMLVEPGLVARGAISAMIARGGKGKTAVSLNRLVRWSMGKPLVDELPDLMKPVGALKVLIIENEGAPGHFQTVLRTILMENDFTEDEIALARENVTIWGDGGWSGLKLDDPENIALVDRAVGETDCDIVFIEPFRGLWRGDENSSTEMANVLDAISDIANRHDCAALLTHHENKSGGNENTDPMSAARGSSVMEAVAAVMERWSPVKGGRQRELSWIKARFAEAPAPVRLEFDREKWSYRHVAEEEGEREVLGLLSQFPGQYMTLAEMKDELGESYQKVRKWSNALAEEGKIKKRSDAGQMHYCYLGSDGSDDETSPLAIT